MDFDNILDQLDIHAEPFAICEIYGTCHVALQPDAAVTLHYILSGAGQITMPKSPPIDISAGSLVLIPSLNSHEVFNDGATVVPGPACKPAALNLAKILKSEPSEEASASSLVALCAHVSIGLMGATDIVHLIREPLVAQAPEGSTMRAMLGALTHELSEPRVGSRALIRALLMQAIISMMRDRMAVQDCTMDWMAALRDPTIWKALSEMLDDPSQPHSVESLAKAAGLSRAVFARRFSEAYGAGPMELLRELRMRKAGDLLKNTNLPVKRIAETVGFSSRSAFNRTFEAISKQSPSSFRKSARSS